MHAVIEKLCRTDKGRDLVNDLRAHAVEREIILTYGRDRSGLRAVMSGELDRAFALLTPGGETLEAAAERRAQGVRVDVEFIEFFLGLFITCPGAEEWGG